MIWKILRPFSNAMIVNGKYSPVKQPVQMQLDQEAKTFAKIFFAFLKSTSNFEHFRKKVTLIANVFPKLRTPKNVTSTMSKKCRFRRSLEKQHGKWKLKFERQHLYHIYWSTWRQLTYKKSVLVICNTSNISNAHRRYSLLNTDNLTKPIHQFILSVLTLCKAIAFTVINKYGKGPVLHISKMFDRLYYVAFRRIRWNRTFEALI